MDSGAVDLLDKSGFDEVRNMNKAKRLIDNMEKEKASEFIFEIGEIDDNATPLKQAKYINNLLNLAYNKDVCMVDTMRKCGGCCISANAIKIAKKLYAKAKDIPDFLQFLNEADIGGRNLHLSGNKIIAIYKKCYCNIPKKIKDMNKSYCECSAGWYMKLFSEVFEKNVSVKIINTIVNGADECTFELSNF